ncbi:stress-responsive transcription factor hsf1 [Entomortierella beljakovae]|nr:stress-responsive transcription factor hsf1 [Entomortierella beljakovae]
MFSTNNGFIDNNSDSNNPRIIELPGNSPLTTSSESINNSDSIDTLRPIITTPESGALSFMPSPPPSTISAPTNMSSLALINTPQQHQQQQASEAAMALLSNLSSSNVSSSPTFSQVNTMTSNRNAANSSRSRSTPNKSPVHSVPLTSNLQSVQSLSRPPNGIRGNVAAFLSKLYNMVGDNASNNLIRWSDDGQSFIVINHVEFAKEVLPKFFKHNNFSSFVRQLNMYGFHKVPHLQQGVLMPDSDSEQWEFSNPNFQKNQPDLLYLVSRKKATGANEDKDAITMDLGHILQEVAAVKRHQVAISTDLKNIERDHQQLWQESITARERHQRQQETIDKILRFLASVFSGDKKRAIVPNKKARLTITDGDGVSNTDDSRRVVEEEDEEEDATDVIQPNTKRKRSSKDNEVSHAIGSTLNNSNPSLNISEISPAMLGNTSQTKNSSQQSSSSTTNTNSSLPTLPTSAASSGSFSLPDYMSMFPGMNFAGTNSSGLKFDPSNLSIPTSLFPNALSPIHHDMLRQISMANDRDTSSHSSAPPLPPLPPSLSQTPSGANAAKGVDQISEEIEQLQRSIEDLSQHQLIGDNFDFDDDAYMPLDDHYVSNGLGGLGNIYGDPINGTNLYNSPTSSLSAVPTGRNLMPSTSTPTVGANPRISTVGEDYLEDLLDLDPV